MTYVLGVDLGTTATAAVALRDDGTLEPLDLDDGPSMPSVVAVGADGDLIVGAAAVRRARTDPHLVSREFKRRFGDPTPIVLGGTPYGTDRLMAALLAEVMAAATRRFGAPPRTLALSHPASWGPYKRELLVEVAHQAGVEDPVLVAEPVAAAVDHATASAGPTDLVAVYDLGGGTFDVALVERQGHRFDLVGTPDGIERFGGIDVDHAVLGIARAEVADLPDHGELDAAAAARVADECRAAKEALSSDTETVVELDGPAGRRQVRVTRARLESVIEPRLADTIDALRRAVTSAGRAVGDLDAVLVVGGASRMPVVADTVRTATGVAVVTDAHPKLVVARGAARVAARERGGAGGVDVTELSSADAHPADPDPDAADPAGAARARSRRRMAATATGTAVIAAGLVAWLASGGADPAPRRTGSTERTTSTTRSATTTDTTTEPSTTAVDSTTAPSGGGSGSGSGGTAPRPTTTSRSTATTAPPTTEDPDVPIVRSVGAPGSVTCAAGSSGGEITVTWSAANASSVTVAVDSAAQLWDSGLPLTGSVRIPYNCPPPSSSKRIYVTAVAPSGITATRSTTVTIVSG